MSRKEITKIPDWTIAPIDRYCDRRGTTVNQLIRDYLVKIAEAESDQIVITGALVTKYKKICRNKGVTAEEALALHMQGVVINSRS